MIHVATAMKDMSPVGFSCFILEAELSKPPAMDDYPFVILWGPPGDRLSGDESSGSLSDIYASERVEVNATYVALTDESLQSVTRAFRDAWDRSEIRVEGYAPTRLKQSSLQPAAVDKAAPTVGNLRPRFTVDRYTFLADRI